MQLQDQVALVTGAGSGIGKAAALLLAKEGAKVAVIGRAADQSQLDETTAQIVQDGGSAFTIVADVAQPDQMQAAVKQTGDQWGRIDIVFANAGINGKWAPIEEITPEDWDTTLDINLKGTFLTIKYAVPYLKKQGGAIIVTASVNGTRMFSNTGASAYATSKAGQVAFTKMIALELAKYKIRANVICPGFVRTPLVEKQIPEQAAALGISEDEVIKKVMLKETVDGEFTTVHDVAEVALLFAGFNSNALTGQSLVVSHGWFMQ